MQTLSARIVLLLLPRKRLTAALDPVGKTSSASGLPRQFGGSATTNPTPVRTEHALRAWFGVYQPSRATASPNRGTLRPGKGLRHPPDQPAYVAWAVGGQRTAWPRFLPFRQQGKKPLVKVEKVTLVTSLSSQPTEPPRKAPFLPKWETDLQRFGLASARNSAERSARQCVSSA